jgi:hypothetical protein
MNETDEPLWRRDVHRWTTERRRFLERAAGLDEPVAAAVAWSELGYSDRAVGEKVDRAADTVSDYLAAVADEYGVRAACACAASDPGVRAPLGDAELGDTDLSREVAP